MATLQITLKNGFFTDHNGVYVRDFKPTYVLANGWECNVSSDGHIKCYSVQEYSDGEHSMHYTVTPQGFAKLTLKLPGEKVRTLKKGYVVPKGTKLSYGILGLASGYIDDRYAYFRDSSFQDFLDKHGITAVKRMDPNDVFPIRKVHYGGASCSSSLITDGKQETIHTDSWQEGWPNTSESELNRYIQVTDATWVLITKTQHEGSRHNSSRMLYSLERDLSKLEGLPNYLERDLSKLEDLPNYMENQKKLKKLQEIGKIGFSSLEALEKELQKVEPNLERFVSSSGPKGENMQYYAEFHMTYEENRIFGGLKTSGKLFIHEVAPFWIAEI